MAIRRTAPEVQPPARVQTSYQQLSIAATDLNSASDELGKAISTLDAPLKKLNLGISAWVKLSEGRNEDTLDWWARSLGYTKIGEKWGIALKRMGGNLASPEDESEECWLFNEAPRWMRIEAVGKIPELLEALLMEAENTTNKLKEKTVQVYDLAVAMNKVAEEAQTAEGADHAHPAE